MLRPDPLKKLFGVALDVADDPWSLQLKWAAMTSTEKGGGGFYSDPYEAIADVLSGYPNLEFKGKFPIPSWQGPRPFPTDAHLVTRENFQQFVTMGGLLKTTNHLKDFVEENIFPGMPIMVGIDHSATGGVISALSKRYDPKKLSIVVLDRHFDAIPLSLRLDGLFKNWSPLLEKNGIDQYCCGNFLAHLIEAEIVLPEHLLLIGVADYPGSKRDPSWIKFRERYLSLEKQGCRFYPLSNFRGNYKRSLAQFIYRRIQTPYAYVSLDLDVGSYSCIKAARYMDGPGINQENLLDTAKILADGNRKGYFSLVGFDIMEFNLHFLGIETADGERDLTLSLVCDFIKTLV